LFWNLIAIIKLNVTHLSIWSNIDDIKFYFGQWERVIWVFLSGFLFGKVFLVSTVKLLRPNGYINSFCIKPLSFTGWSMVLTLNNLAAPQLLQNCLYWRYSFMFLNQLNFFWSAIKIVRRWKWYEYVFGSILPMYWNYRNW
jgi:hypothetical protein